jgi:hypothetical protein
LLILLLSLALPELPRRKLRCQSAGAIAKAFLHAKRMHMTNTDIPHIASSLSAGERAALASLPIRDSGYFSEENWWLYYTLLDSGLLTGSHEMIMRRTELGEAVLQHLQAGNA